MPPNPVAVKSFLRYFVVPNHADKRTAEGDEADNGEEASRDDLCVDNVFHVSHRIR